MAKTAESPKQQHVTGNRVQITYNGVVDQFERNPHKLVSALLQEALDRFNIAQNRHLMSLFDDAGKELQEKSSLKDADVKNHELLVLRQSTVKGG